MNGSVGDLKGIARVVAAVTIGSVYEGSISMDPELEIWKGFYFGDACSE